MISYYCILDKGEKEYINYNHDSGFSSLYSICSLSVFILIKSNEFSHFLVSTNSSGIMYTRSNSTKG